MMSYGLLALVAMMAVGCRQTTPDPPPPSPEDTTGRAPPAAAPLPPPPAPAPSYQAIPLAGGRPFRQLLRDLGPDRLTLLLKLNRVDLAHLRTGDTLYLPTDTTVGWLAAAPLPDRLPMVERFPKFILVAQRTQVVAGYEFGHLVFWGPASTGKRATPTPNGWYHTNWKAKETRSTDNDAWLLKWYFNFENHRGFSFHQYDLPGHPASHACVRMLPEDAEWLFRWADQWTVSSDGRRIERPGTPVLVFGDYDYDRPGPWRELATNPRAATVTAAEVAEAVTRYQPPPATPADSTR